MLNYFSHSLFNNRQLFQSLGKEKSVVYLKDVDPRHLDLLLQYMYKGEINVKVSSSIKFYCPSILLLWFQESELVAVLQVAQGLDIKGLSEQSAGPEEGQTRASSSSTSNQNQLQREPGSAQNKSLHPTSIAMGLKRAQTSSLEPGMGSNSNSKKPRLASPSLELPTMISAQTTSSDISSELAQINVKREPGNPVTIDLDGPGGADTTAGISGFEGLSQEMAFIDTSVTAGFDNEISYEEEQYYDESLGQVVEPTVSSFCLVFINAYLFQH